VPVNLLSGSNFEQEEKITMHKSTRGYIFFICCFLNKQQKQFRTLKKKLNCVIINKDQAIKGSKKKANTAVKTLNLQSQIFNCAFAII
jgi:hypothetical protein